jgi:hypothetical protein
MRSPLSGSLFFALLALTAAPAAAQDREKLAATDNSIRTVMTFKAPAATVQQFLPAGWEVQAIAEGPDKGANLAVYLVDFQFGQGPDGKPLMGAPTLGLVIPARKTGTDIVAGMVPGGYTAQAGVPGAYGNFLAGKVTVDRQSRTEGDGRTVVDETWQIRGDDGARVDFQVKFVRGVPVREKTEMKYYSSTKPEFYRTYRVEQGTDVVRSAAAGVDRATKLSFKASGGRLAPLFDGAEQLIGVTSLPLFSRTIYLPLM